MSRVSAKAIIVNSDSKFLVLTNSYWDSDPGPAYAPDLPGGSLEPGETPEQGLIREVKEEIGIDISNAPRRYIKTCHVSAIGESVAVYVVWANIRDISLDTEHCMFSWLSLEQMQQLAWWDGYHDLFSEVQHHLRLIDGAEFAEYTEAIVYA